MKTLASSVSRLDGAADNICMPLQVRSIFSAMQKSTFHADIFDAMMMREAKFPDANAFQDAPRI